MLHADSRSQDQINVCEKKAGEHMTSSNHAPQYGINTLSGKATMMNKERKPYDNSDRFTHAQWFCPLQEI
jgi:hypothetical protein